MLLISQLDSQCLAVGKENGPERNSHAVIHALCQVLYGLRVAWDMFFSQS